MPYGIAILCHTKPYYAMPYQAMPYHVRLYHVMSYNVIPPEHLSAPCPLLLLIQSVLQTAFQHELIRFLAQHLRWLTSTHCPGSGKRFTLYTLYASSVVDRSPDRNFDELTQNRGPGGQFSVCPYSSFLSISRASVRLGQDIWRQY